MTAAVGIMATSICIMPRQGAKRVYLAAVHPVLTGSAALILICSDR